MRFFCRDPFLQLKRCFPRWIPHTGKPLTHAAQWHTQETRKLRLLSHWSGSTIHALHQRCEFGVHERTLFPNCGSVKRLVTVPSVKYFLRVKILAFSILVAACLCGCSKSSSDNPELKRLTELSNTTPKELHEALFAPVSTNDSPLEVRAWQERSRKAIADYEAKQKR